jgi:DNA invertase Pin-like site-specific DNA recombinase
MNKKYAVIYCRVASAPQVRGGIDSLAGQEKMCRDKLRRDGLHLVGVIHDRGESGMNLKRKGIRKLISLVQDKKIDAVYTTDWTRFARNSGDYLMLREFFRRHGVQVIFCKKVRATASFPMSLQTPFSPSPRI